ncbi:ABC transporter substrate-binding protein [Martelella alba]|uniref:ABC transporter substrate-binding protein n=1 Tax=Martelella alba TaxID=2590451 RepID=A0A506U4J2_9HYPH|nr:ABC transporter substrate-binding protein [Martelella alba]TPW28246.1 ABC transporter substrate-binding protein [Martelella alba]
MCQFCNDPAHFADDIQAAARQDGKGFSCTGVTRRQTLDLLAAGGLAALLGSLTAGLANPARAATSDDEVVRIGYLPITDATPLLVAHGLGYFADEGLEAEKPTLMRGWSPLVEGFASNKFNLVHMLKPIPVWMRYNNDFPVKIMAWAHTNGSGLVVGRHTDAHGFADLGGMTIAVPYWYSMHNIVLQMALKSAGLVPVIKGEGEALQPNEVNLLVMGPPEMPPALAARKIDAYIVAEPFNALGELKAGARMLRFTGDMWKNHPCCVICMNENTVSAKPEWTQKVMNALVRASVYASENKKEVADMLSKDGMGYLPVPSAVVERAMTLYDTPDYEESGAIRHPDWGNGRIDFNPWPYPSATRMIVDAMNTTLVSGDTTFLNGLDPDFVAKDLVNYDYVKAALARYPGWMKDRSVNPDSPFEREEVLAIQ